MNKILKLVAIFLALIALGPLQDVNAKSNKKNHSLSGKASWYGDKFHGKLTASGAIYDKYTHTAAHKTLPFGTVVEVVDQKNARRTVVCITDRGPFVRGRVIDLSLSAANEIDLGTRGIAPVKLRVVSDSNGKMLSKSEAFFVQIHNIGNTKKEKVGPYSNFADAHVMKEVLASEHPEALIIVASTNK